MKWKLYLALIAVAVYVMVRSVSMINQRTARETAILDSLENNSPKVETGHSSTPPPTQAVSISDPQATAQDRHQMAVLDEILASKNDNDPRLDTELREFSPTAKKLMRERYQSLPAEKRNERGTIAFLIGRDLASAEDVAFLGSVLSEPPCLSLSDCTREDKQGDGTHRELGEGVTLAYPQFATLNMLERQIAQAEQGKKLSQIDGIKRILEEASHSPVPAVADKARSLYERAKALKD